MNGTGSHRTWGIMVFRLFRPLLAILVAIALIGAPFAVQAAATLPCRGACLTSMADHADPGHLAAPCKLPASCNSMMPACMGVLSCLSVATLSGPQTVTAQGPSWLPVAYWGDDHKIDGLSVDPALGPPIAI